jgi:ribosomal subunit interface protein
MQVRVSGKHIDIGEALRVYVDESVQKNVKKYFDKAIHAHVTISKEGHLFNTNILVNEGTGNKIIIKGNSSEADPYLSVDTAINKIEKQLRRYKTKIKNHHNKNLHKEFAIEATKYILSPFHDDKEIETSEDAPLIIAEKATTISTLSVGDAVMQMDLHDLPALLFINSGSKKLNLVYYRSDGNISWVDTNILV